MNKQYVVYLMDNLGYAHDPVYFDELEEAEWYVDFIQPRKSIILHIHITENKKELLPA